MYELSSKAWSSSEQVFPFQRASQRNPGRSVLSRKDVSQVECAGMFWKHIQQQPRRKHRSYFLSQSCDQAKSQHIILVSQKGVLSLKILQWKLLREDPPPAEPLLNSLDYVG